ncbi:Fic/DOC family protein [Spirosomataceae bacterium TFI 002]|nr:Fic/DOC family protein [Spirosomataceae bacterium TFI 002]
MSHMELSVLTGIDQALLSKYENDKRLPSKNHIKKLGLALGDSTELRKAYLAEKVYDLVKYENNIHEILQVAEARVEYLTSSSALILDPISDLVKSKLTELDLLHEQWANAKPLNQTQLLKMQEYFNVAYTYDSNKIEGNTLTLQETHLVVNEGITIGGKSMREHLEAINHQDAIDFIREMAMGKEDINPRNVLDMHQLILKSIDTPNAGIYRKINVRISGSEHTPPEHFLLGQLMEDFHIHYERQKRVLHPVLLAAEMHERLVSIHPFVDGNGRTARLLMNYILLKNGFTIAILKGDPQSRMDYYKSLEAVQVNNNPEPFYLLIIEKVKESLIEHLNMV